LDPTYIEGYIQKGNAHLNQTLHGEAIEFYDSGLKIDKDNKVAMYNKGVGYTKSGKYDQALDCY
jgi:tetratricopeptide (TPR) repeat protein